MWTVYAVSVGYKNPRKQREYQREWRRARRRRWIEESGPCAHCGSRSDLEVDHVDSSKKISHNVWSWSQARLEKELAKCQVLCVKCHKKKSSVSLDGQHVFSEELVRKATTMRGDGHSIRAIAKATGISKSQVHQIVSGKSRQEVRVCVV